jgi:hypothetical protein
LRKLTMMVAVMAVVLAMAAAGALAFSPKAAEAAPEPRTWCFKGGDTTLGFCTAPAPGESDAEVRARCEAVLANTPESPSQRCTPSKNFGG